MARWLAILFGLFAVAIDAPGCGPAVAKSDMGNIVYEVPKVAGADKPYPIPEVLPPLAAREPDF